VDIKKLAETHGVYKPHGDEDFECGMWRAGAQSLIDDVVKLCCERVAGMMLVDDGGKPINSDWNAGIGNAIEELEAMRKLVQSS
jgi:hypothetical protein